MSEFGGVLAAIDFYTFEGGQFSLLASNGNSQVLNCSVTNTTLPGGGSFSLTLAPGGPSGIAASPQWSEIITPMSLCVITLCRSSTQNVVQVGVVSQITEQQSWSQNSVSRTVTVTGYDLASYFWNQFSFASLAYLAGNVLAPLGQGIVGNPGGGWFLNAGFQGVVSPSQFAQNYYSQVMFQSGGLLGRTRVPYQGSTLPLSGIVGTRFDAYNAAEIVPYADSYLTSDGPWMQKFNEALPFPVYENFTISAPINLYAPLNYTSGYSFNSSIFPSAIPAMPQFICRLQPQPDLTLQSTGNSSNPYNFSGVDLSQFTPLVIYEPAYDGFIDSSITFSPNNNYNFYTLNSLGINYLWGGSNTNINAIQLYNFSMLADPASISRYGYRPMILSNSWFVNFDPNGSSGLSSDQFQNLVARVMTRLASYMEPLPLMGNGGVTMEARPDIFPGNLFTWSPFRQTTDEWVGYINTVTHNYIFGGPTTTTLTVERCLPQGVYAESDLLTQILQGNAQRINGQYASGVPSGLGQALVGYAVQNQTSLLAAIAAGYMQPQYK